MVERDRVGAERSRRASKRKRHLERALNEAWMATTRPRRRLESNRQTVGWVRETGS